MLHGSKRGLKTSMEVKHLGVLELHHISKLDLWDQASGGNYIRLQWLFLRGYFSASAFWSSLLGILSKGWRNEGLEDRLALTLGTPLGCLRTVLLSQSYTSKKSLPKIKMLMQAHPKHTKNSKSGNPLRQKYLGSGKALTANLAQAQPVLDAPEVAADGPCGRQGTAQWIHQSGQQLLFFSIHGHTPQFRSPCFSNPLYFAPGWHKMLLLISASHSSEPWVKDPLLTHFWLSQSEKKHFKPRFYNYLIFQVWLVLPCFWPGSNPCSKQWHQASQKHNCEQWNMFTFWLN